MSKKRRLAKAIMAGAALYGLTRPMMGAGKETVSDAQKKSQVMKAKTPKRVIDTGAKTMVDTPVKTTVDVDALPREVSEKASKVKAANEKMKKKVLKRRDEGMLSPTMPKRANQLSSDFGLGIMDGAKKGKMIKARGGGMAMKGMKPTKLY